MWRFCARHCLEKSGKLRVAVGLAFMIVQFLAVSASAQWSRGGVVVVKRGLNLSGNSSSFDSFDSRDPAKSTAGRYDASQYSGDQGNIIAGEGIADSLNLGNVRIYGTLHTGPGASVTLGVAGAIGPHGSQVTNVSDALQAGYIVPDAAVTFPDTSLPSDYPTYLTPVGGVVVTWSTNITSTSTNAPVPPNPPPWGGTVTNVSFSFTTLYPTPPPPGLTTNYNSVTNSSVLSYPFPADVSTNYLTTLTNTSGYPSPGTYTGTVSTNYSGPGGNKQTYTYNYITGWTYNYTVYVYSFPNYTYTYKLYQTNTVYSTNRYDYVLNANTKYVANNLGGTTCVAGPNAFLVLPTGLTGSETFVFGPGASLVLYAGGASGVLSGNQLQGVTTASRLLVFGAPSVTRFTLNGTSEMDLVLVAPNADVTLNGAGGTRSDFCGAILANSVKTYGAFGFHYDEALSTPAWAPTFPWASSGSNELSGGAYGGSWADALATDTAGNVLVAGRFTASSLDLGGTVLDGALGNNFLCKYDNTGALQWARLAGFLVNGATLRLRVGTDAAGNAYCAGHFTGIANFGNLQLTNGGTADLFLVKFSPQGQALWARQIGAYDPQDYSPTFGFATDPAGNVFLAGSYAGAADFGSLLLTNTGGFLAKYDTAGNLVWAYDAPRAQALALGSSGALYLAPPGTLAKYNGQGQPLWSKPFPRATALAVDRQENLYATGYGAGTYDGLTLTNSGGLPDFFVARCDASGTLQWLRQVGSTTEQHGLALALDRSGGLFVSSVSAEARFDPVLSFGTFSLTNVCAFVAEYDTAGNALWARPLVTTRIAGVWGLDTLSPGVVAAAGHYRNSLTLDNVSLSEAPNSMGTFFAAKVAGLTPPQLRAPVQLNGAAFQLTIDGATGFHCVVEGSTDLLHWVPLATNALPFTFTDDAAPSHLQRFYRVSYRP